MRVKNMSGESQVWVGQTIEDGATYDIEAGELFKWQQDDDVMSDLSSGDLEIGDGTSYKAPGAAAIQFLLGADTLPKDATGRPISRIAITQDGFAAQFHAIGFCTSKLNAVYNKDDAGNDLGFATAKFYDSEGVELTTQEDIDTDCVKTVISWMPTHDYDIVGGQLMQSGPPSTNIYLWVKALPGILNLMFAQGGMNLKLAGQGGIADFDGRASKFLPYTGGAGTNKFQLIMKHDAGVQHELQLVFELFKA
jgi:hypothetical protein